MSRIFITGSSDGLGMLAAKSLVAAGHHVVLHARNKQRAGDAMKAVPAAERILTGDLSSMDETKQLATAVNEIGKFDAVIHNAGLYHVADRASNVDGIPLLFAVNSLAPYILTALINPPNRLIYLSSGMHMHGDAAEQRLQSISAGKHYPGYSDTKLHDVLLALAVARRWPDVISNAVDPGWVPTKMGGSHAPDDLDKGYQTQVWLAVSQDEEAMKSGRYLHHKREKKCHSQARDEHLQEKYLEVCEKISGISLK